MATDTDTESDSRIRPDHIDEDVNARFDQQIAGERIREDLENLENKGDISTADFDRSKDPSDTAAIKDLEERGNQQKPTWKDATVPKQITNKNQLAKVLWKKGGPVGGLLAILLVIGGLLGGILTPGSLFLNLKENLTLNWDQQNYTAEIRSRAILNKRFGLLDSSHPVCAKLPAVCDRYTKPSQRMLNEMDRAGIKAVDSAGNVIEKQRLIGGTRPAEYVTADGAHVKPSEFKGALENDVKFRNAFRRAYNPRWVNWFDDLSLKFLQKIGLSKAVNKTISEAADSAASRKAVEEVLDGKNKAIGATSEAAETTMKGLVDTEARVFTKTALAEIGFKSNGVLGGAVLACMLAKTPGVYTTVLRNFRIAQMAAVVFPMILVAADAIKAGNGSDKIATNTGNALTERPLLPDGSLGKSAMDSGAIMYGLLGDRGSAARSQTVKKYIPGYTGNSFLNMAASFGSSQQVKDVCGAVSSDAAQVAVAALSVGAGPAGWVNLGLSVIMAGLNATGALTEILKAIEPALTGAVASLASMVDWQGILKTIWGDITQTARYEEFGDMIGVLATVMANLANSGGNGPLTPAQAVSFQQEVANPVRLAWAEEDRLTRSPFDITSPNTVMGAIVTPLIPYLSSTASVSSVINSTFGMVGSIPSNLLTPRAQALSTADFSMCPEEGDYAVATSGVAAGPLCDVQYGILPKFLGVDPLDVFNWLFEFKGGQIDEKGEVKEGSDLENWMMMCNTGNTYTLSQCVATEEQGDNQEATRRAYYGLYQIDQRLSHGMDNEPKANVETPPSNSTPIISTDNTGPCADGTIDMGIYDNAHDDGKKTSIRLCAVTNLSAPAYATSPYYKNIKAVDPAKQEQATGKALVNARASDATYKMIEAANTAGVSLTLGSYFAFRSYEHQTALRIDWCNKGDCGGAALPGYSNHEMGLAIDFDLPGKAHSETRTNSDQLQWLRAHAKTSFGFDDTAMPKEDWHWAYIK